MGCILSLINKKDRIITTEYKPLDLPRKCEICKKVINTRCKYCEKCYNKVSNDIYVQGYHYLYGNPYNTL